MIKNKKLYEKILINIAKEIKKTINETYLFDYPGDLTLTDTDMSLLANEIFKEIFNNKISGITEFEPENKEYFLVSIYWNIKDGIINCSKCIGTWCDRDGADATSEINLDINKLQTKYNEILKKHLPF